MNEWEWQLLEDKTPVDHLRIGGVEVRREDRVRLRPRTGGDVFDIALAGQTPRSKRRAGLRRQVPRLRRA